MVTSRQVHKGIIEAPVGLVEYRRQEFFYVIDKCCSVEGMPMGVLVIELWEIQTGIPIFKSREEFHSAFGELAYIV